MTEVAFEVRGFEGVQLRNCALKFEWGSNFHFLSQGFSWQST